MGNSGSFIKYSNANRAAELERHERNSKAAEETTAPMTRVSRPRLLAVDNVDKFIRDLQNGEERLIRKGVTREELNDLRDDVSTYNDYNKLITSYIDEAEKLIETGVSFKEITKLCRVNSGISLTTILENIDITTRLLKLEVSFEDITDLAIRNHDELSSKYQLIKHHGLNALENDYWVNTAALQNILEMSRHRGNFSGSIETPAGSERTINFPIGVAEEVIKFLGHRDRTKLPLLSGSGYREGNQEYDSVKRSYREAILRERKESERQDMSAEDSITNRGLRV